MSNDNRTMRAPAVSDSRGRSTMSRWLPMLVVVFVFLVAPFAGSAAEILAGPSDDELVAGADVYSRSCSACHQAGGVGVAGQFPPLIGNPNVDDAEYVRTVVAEGLSGEIEVNGQTFDGVMPAQSTLSDSEVEAVIAYIQSGFATPEVAVPEVVPGSSGSSATRSVIMIAIYGFLGLAVVMGATVFRQRIIAVNDPREIPWSDAWMKTSLIVVGLILATTMIPVWTWESGFLRDLSGTTRDLVTVGVWAVGLSGSLFILWYLHRKNRI